MASKTWRPIGWKNPYPERIDAKSWDINSLTHIAFEEGANAMMPFVLFEIGRRFAKRLASDDASLILSREFINALLRGEMIELPK